MESATAPKRPRAQALKEPLPTPPKSRPPSKRPTSVATAPMPASMTATVSRAMEDDDTPPATDHDLRRAFEPLVESSLERVLYAPDKGLHTYLEPMLRSTVRRAIAEQIDAAVQFRSTGTVDRLGWRLKALMTSRSYDEVVFRSTRRYQVEEAFLLRREDYSLVSFASMIPHDTPLRSESLPRSRSSFDNSPTTREPFEKRSITAKTRWLSSVKENTLSLSP